MVNTLEDGSSRISPTGWVLPTLVASAMMTVACAHDPSPAAARAHPCEGLATKEREKTFAQDVIAVRNVRRRQGKQMIHRTLGADVIVMARRGDSAPWLERLARCRLSEGWFDASDDVELSVFGDGSRFVVRVIASDPAAGPSLAERTRERWTPRRAQR